MAYDKFEENLPEIVDRICEKIDKGKLRLEEILRLREENTRKLEEYPTRTEQEIQMFKKLKILQDQEKLDTERKIYILYDETKLLTLSNLCSKCKIDLYNVTDHHHLLDLRKNVFHLTTELREILDEVTLISKFVGYCGEDKHKMMKELSQWRDDAASEVTKFSDSFSDLIQEWDITEEKLKSGFNLKIDLDKFQGYDSCMDIYTFRSEFEKLIQHVVLCINSGLIILRGTTFYLFVVAH